MKLKYYLRGLGVGIICTAILMGIALSGNKKEKLTDTEIIERARLLGMVMADEADNADAIDPDSQDAEGSDALGKEQNGSHSDGQDAADQSGEGSDGQDAAGQNGEGSDGQDAAAQQGESPSAKDGTDSDSQGKKGQESAAQDGTDPNGQAQGTSGQKEDSAADKGQDTNGGMSGNKPASDSNRKEGMVEFEITERDHSEAVSQKLFEAGLISDASKFNQYMIDKKMDNYLQSGKYQIPAGATEDEILEMIVRLP